MHLKCEDCGLLFDEGELIAEYDMVDYGVEEKHWGCPGCACTCCTELTPDELEELL